MDEAIASLQGELSVMQMELDSTLNEKIKLEEKISGLSRLLNEKELLLDENISNTLSLKSEKKFQNIDKKSKGDDRICTFFVRGRTKIL